MSLSKDAIMAAKDAVIETVDVTAWWGDVVNVRGMCGSGRDRLEELIHQARTNGQADAERVTFPNMRAFVAVRCLCDDDGEFLFTEADIPAMAKKDSVPLGLIFDAGTRLSGITEGDVDQIMGESESDLSGGTGSSSPIDTPAPSLSSSASSTPATSPSSKPKKG